MVTAQRSLECLSLYLVRRGGENKEDLRCVALSVILISSQPSPILADYLGVQQQQAATAASMGKCEIDPLSLW